MRLVWLVAALVIALPSAAEAQDAAALAARVESFYGTRPSMRATFRQHFWSHDYGRTLRSTSGTLSVLRPGRFRLEYEGGTVDVSNGTELVHFEPGDGTWPGQYARGDAEGLTERFSFLTATTPLDRDYTVRLPDRVFGDAPPPDCDVLELVPRAADPHVRRIWLFVSHAAGSEGRIERVSIESPAHDWNRYDFSAPSFETLAPGTFEFTPPEGAREITGPRG